MSPNKTVSQKIDDLQEMVLGIIGTLGTMSNDITGLKQDVSVLKQDVSVLKQDVSVLKQDVSELRLGFNHLDKKVDLLTDKFLSHEVKTDKRLRIVETKHGIYHD